jgi:hypothetical protein
MLKLDYGKMSLTVPMYKGIQSRQDDGNSNLTHGGGYHPVFFAVKESVW